MPGNSPSSPKRKPRPLPQPGFGIAVISEREGLGDGFFKLHLLRAIKRAYPEEKIVWIVSESASPYGSALARIATPYISQVIGDARLLWPRREAIRRLKALPPFSLVIDHRNGHKTVLATKLLLRTAIYQAATPGYLFCSRRPRGWPFPPLHKLAQLMALLGAVTGTPVDGSGEIDLLPAALAEAMRLLPEGRRYVGLAPGASQRTRCWPLERFIALAGWIEAQAWQPVLLLGPGERDFLAPLREALPRALFPGCGDGETLNDVELALAFGRRFSAAVSHDTGTGHLFAGVGTPLVCLFGPSNPKRWGPVVKPPSEKYLRILRARDYGGAAIEHIPLEAVTSALAALMR
jgi:ADP-heptose:LPS heptosyltransferase